MSFTIKLKGLIQSQNTREGKRSTKSIKKMTIGTLNNYFTCKRLKCSNQRHRLAEWIQKQDPFICCLQEIHFRPKEKYRLKVIG